jgi:hypothetical protein
MRWISAIRTGQYSDTSIFIVGAFDTEDEARSAAEGMVKEVTEIVDAVKAADSFEEELKAEKRLQELLGVDYFTIYNEWDTVVGQVPDAVGGRVFKIF